MIPLATPLRLLRIVGQPTSEIVTYDPAEHTRFSQSHLARVPHVLEKMDTVPWDPSPRWIHSSLMESEGLFLKDTPTALPVHVEVIDWVRIDPQPLMQGVALGDPRIEHLVLVPTPGRVSVGRFEIPLDGLGQGSYDTFKGLVAVAAGGEMMAVGLVDKDRVVFDRHACFLDEPSKGPFRTDPVWVLPTTGSVNVVRDLSIKVYALRSLRTCEVVKKLAGAANE